MNLGENVSNSALYWSVTERAMLSTSLLLIMIFAILGNTLVLVVLIRNRGMRTRTNLFLGSLAVADLLCSVFDMPFSLVTVIRAQWIFSDALCLVSGFTTPLFIVASIHTLMYISVHKFVTIRDPHNHSLTKRRVGVMISAAWAWAIIASAVSISGLTEVNHSRYTTQCSPKYPDDAKSYTHLVLAIVTCYLVPFVVIAVCSIGMFVVIRSYGKRMRNSSTVDEDEIYAQQRHVTVTLFLVVVTFVVCWTPIVVYSIYSTVIRDEERIHHLANPIVSWFGYLNSACNPVIYAFRSEAFREGYKQVVWGIKKQRRGSSTDSTSSMSLRQRIGYLLHRDSTMSSNVFSISSRPSSSSDHAPYRHSSTASSSMRNGDLTPSAADYRAALNVKDGLQLEADENDDHITALRVPLNAAAIEMQRLKGDGALAETSEDDEENIRPHTKNSHLMVSFSEHDTMRTISNEAEGASPGNAGTRRPNLLSFPSIEHLDTADDSSIRSRHLHHHRKRKFRGGIGGLHRSADERDADNDFDDNDELENQALGPPASHHGGGSAAAHRFHSVGRASDLSYATPAGVSSQSTDVGGGRHIYKKSGGATTAQHSAPPPPAVNNTRLPQPVDREVFRVGAATTGTAAAAAPRSVPAAALQHHEPDVDQPSSSGSRPPRAQRRRRPREDAAGGRNVASAVVPSGGPPAASFVAGEESMEEPLPPQPVTDAAAARKHQRRSAAAAPPRQSGGAGERQTSVRVAEEAEEAEAMGQQRCPRPQPRASAPSARPRNSGRGQYEDTNPPTAVINDAQPRGSRQSAAPRRTDYTSTVI
jgi:hypothetical protein